MKYRFILADKQYEEVDSLPKGDYWIVDQVITVDEDLEITMVLTVRKPS
jgi:hypothetical protein